MGDQDPRHIFFSFYCSIWNIAFHSCCLSLAIIPRSLYVVQNLYWAEPPRDIADRDGLKRYGSHLWEIYLIISFSFEGKREAMKSDGLLPTQNSNNMALRRLCRGLFLIPH